MIYSDEDVVDDAGMVEHHPKPGWSPEHMSALMYTCHLGVYRRAGRRARRLSDRVRRLPGLRLRAAADGADRPDRPHPPDPLPLARPRPIDRRRRPGQAVRVPGSAGRDRRPPAAQRGRGRGPVRARARDSPHRAPSPPVDQRRPRAGGRRSPGLAEAAARGWPSRIRPGASCSPGTDGRIRRRNRGAHARRASPSRASAPSRRLRRRSRHRPGRGRRRRHGRAPCPHGEPGDRAHPRLAHPADRLHRPTGDRGRRTGRPVAATDASSTRAS